VSYLIYKKIDVLLKTYLFTILQIPPAYLCW